MAAPGAGNQVDLVNGGYFDPNKRLTYCLSMAGGVRGAGAGWRAAGPPLHPGRV